MKTQAIRALTFHPSTANVNIPLKILSSSIPMKNEFNSAKHSKSGRKPDEKTNIRPEQYSSIYSQQKYSDRIKRSSSLVNKPTPTTKRNHNKQEHRALKSRLQYIYMPLDIVI